jgi:hypothetical protein
MRYLRNEMSKYTGKRRLASFNQWFPNVVNQNEKGAKGKEN